MNESLVTGLIALAGTTLGWLLGRADSWVARREHKVRVSRRTVSFLLDIRHILTNAALSVKGGEMPLLKALEIRLLKHMSPDHVNQVLSTFNRPEILFALMSMMSTMNIVHIQNGYAKVIEDLAECDAVMAYYLRGKTELWSVVDMLSDQVNTWSGLGDPALSQHAGQSIKPAATAMIMVPMRNELTDMIEQLSAKLPRAERRSIKIAMSGQDEKLGGGITPSLEAMLGQMEQSILSQLGIKAEPSASSVSGI
jgi:hypothetical protein